MEKWIGNDKHSVVKSSLFLSPPMLKTSSQHMKLIFLYSLPHFPDKENRRIFSLFLMPLNSGDSMSSTPKARVEFSLNGKILSSITFAALDIFQD